MVENWDGMEGGGGKVWFAHHFVNLLGDFFR